MTLAIAAQETTSPAFLIVAADRNPEFSDTDYGPYRQAAGPLANATGLSMTGASQVPEVLEEA